MTASASKSRVQGEGDYASARKYNEHARELAQSGKVEQAAQDAAPRNAQQKGEMRQAGGRAHAKSQSKVEPDKGSPGRPKPVKKAPGKHPQGHNPIPEKLPGR